MKKMAFMLAACLAATVATAGDWSNWRGPNFDGSSPETNLPKEFGKDKNVKWGTSLPGPGASTPIVVGDHIFLTSIDQAKGGLLAICVDRNTGKILWQDDASSRYQAGGGGTPVNISSRSNYASPSAVTDGKLVVFSFGNGDVVCYDNAGKKQWSKNLQKEYGDFTYQWTFSATPALWEGRLIINVLQRDEVTHGRGKDGNESFLVAFDVATGKQLWKHVRPSPAKKESLEAYGTPIPYVKNGRKEVVILGGDILTGHDPATGKEYWRWGTYNPNHREAWWRVVPSAVIGDDVILASGPKGCAIHAVKAGLAGEHKADSGLAWVGKGKKTPISTDVPTPLFYDGSFFVVSDVRKALSRVEPKSGRVLWTVPLTGKWKYRSSPIGADGRIWVMNHNGQLFAFSPKDGSLLGQGNFADDDADRIRSSVSIAHGNLFVRTNDKLFCVGK